jgi:hypothetical protein
MSASFTRRTNSAAGAITVDERSEAEELVASKFATEAWTYLLP